MLINLRDVFKSSWFRLLLGFSFSSISLFLVLREVSLIEVGAAVFQARWDYVVLAFAIIAFNTVAKAIRWKVLLGRPGQNIALHTTFASLLVGQMLNTLYPGRLGELSRAYTIGRLGPGVVFTFGTVALEKLFDMLLYALLFLLLLLLIPLPSWVSDSAYVLMFTAFVFSALIYLVSRRRDWVISLFERVVKILPDLWHGGLIDRLTSGLKSLDVLDDRDKIFKLVLWSVVVWGTAILINHITLLSLSLSLPYTASMLVLVVLQAGISLPSIPGKFGLFQLACIWSLAFFGIEHAPALGFGILLHALVLGPTTILGVVYFILFTMQGQSMKIRELTKNTRLVDS
jgi:glycosyltransferase 2 family protein